MNIAIIGGGIGGLTTAIALRQHDINADVYEQAAQWKPLGAGLVLSPNAMQVLARLRVADAIQQSGHPLERMQILDHSGRLLQSADVQQFARKFGVGTIAIHRARLHKALLQAIPTERVHLRKRCANLSSSASSANLEFGDGSSLSADLIIAADGLNSAARKWMHPSLQPRYSGQSSYRAVVKFDLPPDLRRTSQEHWAPRCRFGFAPIQEKEVYCYITFDALAGEQDTPTQAKERLTAIAQKFSSPVPELAANIAYGEIVRTDISDYAPFAPWHRDRIVLLGDAAHPATPNYGQGAAQAIEDAYFLARQIDRSSDVESALSNFEQLRRAKTTMINKRAWTLGKVAHMANPVARWMRNLAIAATPQSFSNRELKRLFTLQF